MTYEDIVNEIKIDLLRSDPDLALTLELESEPLVKLIEVIAYRLLDVQNKINHLSESTTAHEVSHD